MNYVSGDLQIYSFGNYMLILQRLEFKGRLCPQLVERRQKSPTEKRKC